MNSNWWVLGLYSSLIMNLGSFLQADGACEQEKQQASQCNSEFEAYQNETLRAMKRIFSEQQPCSTGREEKLQKDIKAKVDRMDRRLKVILAALWKPGNNQDYARVPQSVVTAKMNAPVQLSCGSGGRPLSLCMWELNKINGHSETIVIDEVEAEGGRISKHFSTHGRGLTAGWCGIKILAATSDDLGEWRCSLVTVDDQILIGELDVIDESEVMDTATDAKIYVATAAGEVKALSAKTSKVTRIIVNQAENFYGIAVDTIRNKLYWSSSSKIYRSRLNGMGVATVLDTNRYGTLWGLGIDWITGNLYVASRNGFILACGEAPGQNFRCATILTGQGDLGGITLDPSRRMMYFTKRSYGTIMRAATDGSNPTQIIAYEGSQIFGITVNVHSSRLYWINQNNNKIQSSGLDGSARETIAEPRTLLYGIALVQQRLFWVPYDGKRVESGAIAGGDISSVYCGGEGKIMNLASADWSLAINQTNPCEGKTCSGVCVLTSTNWRCMA